MNDKLRITCSFQVAELPIAYRMGIVSIIKDALKLSDETYYEQLYGGTPQSKPFVFAPYFHEFQLEGNKIVLKKMDLTLSSPDHEFLLHFYNGLQKKKQFQYKKHEFVRDAIHMQAEELITESSVVFKTQSPMLVENEVGKPLAPASSDYNYHFNYLADMILKEYRGIGLFSPLRMEPLKMKKVVIKETNHYFIEQFGEKKYLFYTGYQGLFRLTGEPADLQLLYQLGISLRRNQGFGLFKIA